MADFHLGIIAAVQEPNYLRNRLEEKMQLFQSNPEAFSQHHRIVLQTFQQTEDINNPDAVDSLEGTNFWIMEDVSFLVLMNGFVELHQQLEPEWPGARKGSNVIVVPSSANSQEQVYILPEETDWFVQGYALYANGGTLYQFGLTVNERTIWVYAPSVEAATPAFNALVKLAMKFPDDTTLELVAGWADSAMSDPIDLPLQAINIVRTGTLKKLVVQNFNVLSGQEGTLMACATELSFRNCSASDDVSYALVHEALNATHLEKIELRYSNLDVVELLLGSYNGDEENRGRLNTPDNAGRIPLHHAVTGPRYDNDHRDPWRPAPIATLRLVLDRYTEGVWVADTNGMLPLHALCTVTGDEESNEESIVEYVSLLLEPDLSTVLQPRHDGMTPLQLAFDTNHRQTLDSRQFLLAKQDEALGPVYGAFRPTAERYMLPDEIEAEVWSFVMVRPWRPTREQMNA